MQTSKTEQNRVKQRSGAVRISAPAPGMRFESEAYSSLGRGKLTSVGRSQQSNWSRIGGCRTPCRHQSLSSTCAAPFKYFRTLKLKTHHLSSSKGAVIQASPQHIPPSSVLDTPYMVITHLPACELDPVSSAPVALDSPPSLRLQDTVLTQFPILRHFHDPALSQLRVAFAGPDFKCPNFQARCCATTRLASQVDTAPCLNCALSWPISPQAGNNSSLGAYRAPTTTRLTLSLRHPKTYSQTSPFRHCVDVESTGVHLGTRRPARYPRTMYFPSPKFYDLSTNLLAD
ncbi:hypothetical protein AB1N83_013071 [Pleurotus pulmonarius]